MNIFKRQEKSDERTPAVAKRYALALFQLAKEKQLLDQLEEELRVVKEVLKQNKDFNRCIKPPKAFKREEKTDITQTYFQL